MSFSPPRVDGTHERYQAEAQKEKCAEQADGQDRHAETSGRRMTRGACHEYKQAAQGQNKQDDRNQK